MKIFVSHSKNFDFVNELYLPLKNSSLGRAHEIFLPHEDGRNVLTKGIIKKSDIVIAEVSFPSTGQGVELGWAETFGKPIICFYKKGSKLSDSLRRLTKIFVIYRNKKEMIDKLNKTLENMEKSRG